MLPKRKGTRAPRPKPNPVAGKCQTIDVVEQLQQQIEEEREKMKNEKLNKEKTPLLQKKIVKKKNIVKEKPKEVVSEPKDEYEGKSLFDVPKSEPQSEKKYADSSSISTEPMVFKKLEPTAFTYFDRLADRDILLSDSD